MVLEPLAETAAALRSEPKPKKARRARPGGIELEIDGVVVRVERGHLAVLRRKPPMLWSDERSSTDCKAQAPAASLLSVGAEVCSSRHKEGASPTNYSTATR
jgi:hypothetical protein